jgi:hypothetical protein
VPRPIPSFRSAALAAGLLLALAPDAAAQAMGCPTRSGTHISIHESGERRTLLIADRARCLEVRSVGDVEFTDDDADVRRLAPGGSLRVEETRDGVTRRVEFTERDGQVTRRFALDGRTRDEAEGASWLRTLLPQVARESHIGAPARAMRLLGQRGAQGLLDEAALIASDGVKRIYVTTLLEQGRPTAADLRAVARFAQRSLSSDSDKSRVLRAVVEHRAADPAVVAAVVESARSIASDSDKGRVLAAAVASPGAGPDTQAQVASAARTIASDRTKGELLAAIAPGAGASETMRTAWIEGARTIASDSERRRVLLAALEPGAQADALLSGPSGRDALFDAVDGIASDRDRAAVLRALLRRDALPLPALVATLRSAGRIASDREKADVLMAASARRETLTNEEVRRTFLQATRTIASSSEYRRVMESVVR